MSYESDIIGLTSLGILLLIPPLFWHGYNKNIPALILIFWLLIMDIICLVNAAIWSGLDFMDVWDGKGWCDLAIKLQVGANVGISCSVTNIVYNLYEILKADKVILEWNSWKRIARDLSMSLLTPIGVMGFSYLLQVFRYGIARYNGCQNLLTPTWITIILYTIWMVIWTIAGAILAGMVLFTFYKRRKDVQDILHCTNSGLNLARFSRLLIFCLVILLVMFPFSLYTFAVDLKDLTGDYSFSETHAKETWDIIYKFDPGKPIYNVWLYVLMSYLVFLIFGLGKDAVKMYVKFFRAIGLGSIIDTIISNKQKRKDNKIDKVYDTITGFNEHSSSSSSKYNSNFSEKDDDPYYYLQSSENPFDEKETEEFIAWNTGNSPIADSLLQESTVLNKNDKEFESTSNIEDSTYDLELGKLSDSDLMSDLAYKKEKENKDLHKGLVEECKNEISYHFNIKK